MTQRERNTILKKKITEAITKFEQDKDKIALMLKALYPKGTELQIKTPWGKEIVTRLDEVTVIGPHGKVHVRGLGGDIVIVDCDCIISVVKPKEKN